MTYLDVIIEPLDYGRRQKHTLYRATLLEAANPADTRTAEDLLLAIVDHAFLPVGEPVELGSTLNMNRAWLPGAGSGSAIRIEPVSSGEPTIRLSLGRPPQTLAEEPLAGYRQLSTMLLQAHDPQRPRQDPRDRTLMAACYLTAIRAAWLDVAGPQALRAVTAAAIAVSHAYGSALELDDPMPLGYLDALIARGALGVVGVVSNRCRWIEGPQARALTHTIKPAALEAALEIFSPHLVEICASVDDDPLEYLLRSNIPLDNAQPASAHVEIAAAAFLEAAAPYLSSPELLDHLDAMGSAIERAWPRPAA